MYFLLVITLIVFSARNINRLINELERYDYNPIINTDYKFIGGDQNFHFRFNKLMRDNIENYNSIEFLNKNIYILYLASPLPQNVLPVTGIMLVSYKSAIISVTK